MYIPEAAMLSFLYLLMSPDSALPYPELLRPFDRLLLYLQPPDQPPAVLSRLLLLPLLSYLPQPLPLLQLPAALPAASQLRCGLLPLRPLSLLQLLLSLSVLRPPAAPSALHTGAVNICHIFFGRVNI